MKHIIGIVGFIAQGKDTIGDYLVNKHNFESMSFASPLKDAVASIFGWSRDMIQGSTLQSRHWREQPDEFWSERLGRPITPRQVLQTIGTDILRTHFSQNIWICSLENRLLKSDKSVVITDCRFDNEIEMIEKLGGEIWWVQRGPLPIWYDTATQYPEKMPNLYPSVHITEYRWLMLQHKFKVIQNNSTLGDLYTLIDKSLK